MAEVVLREARTKRRSLELAAAKRRCDSHQEHGAGDAHMPECEVVSLEISIPSAHHLDRIYSVIYQPWRDDAECECEAAQYKRPCWHRGVGITVGRQAARAAKMWSDSDVQSREGDY